MGTPLPPREGETDGMDFLQRVANIVDVKNSPINFTYLLFTVVGMVVLPAVGLKKSIFVQVYGRISFLQPDTE